MIVNEVSCWFDGGCGPKNPGGQAVYGAIVKNESGETLLAESCSVGSGPEMSNNVAEYCGVIAVLRFLIQHKIERGVIYGDSKLVVKQLNKRWKIRKGLYRTYALEALKLKRELPLVEVRWTPRENNRDADRLAGNAYTKVLRENKRKEQLVNLIKAQKADVRETVERQKIKYPV